MLLKFRTLTNFIFRNSRYIALFLILFFAYSTILPRSGHGWDLWCWAHWTKFIFTNGLGNAYKSGTDYLPLYHYVLFVFGKLQGNTETIDRNINYLKIITLLFDFTTGFYLITYLKEKLKDTHQSVLLSLFFFLNICYLYNTIIWNQIDGIMACFVFLAFLCACKQQVTSAIIFIVLAINLKLQSIIFIPLIGLILLPVLLNQFSVKRLIKWISVPVIAQLLIVLPFLWAGDWQNLWNVVSHSVDKFPMVSMNAFNFWTWVVNGDLTEVSDHTRFWGITYKSWGLYLFFITSFIALFSLLKNVFHAIRCKQNISVSHDKLLIIAALIPLLFFFCNTQMHERYAHPALIFLAAYSLSTGKYIPYILGSIAYFLNLEKVLQYWQLKNYGTFIFDPRLIAFLFALCIVFLFVDLFKKQSQEPRTKSQD